MFVLTSNSIKDFQLCERLYDYRHVEKLPETIYSRDLSILKFENSLRNIINFFWFKKQAGITPSYASLLKRWEKIWFPKETSHYDLSTQQHESVYGNMTSLTTQAANVILNFYETYSTLEAIPISISDDYVVAINKDIKVEDKFDLIYKNDNINYVVKFIFNYKNSHRQIYQVDFSIMYLGFKNLHPSKMSTTKFGYIDLMSNNLSFNEYEVNQQDVESINYWCDTIKNKKVFVPRRGMTSYCKKCPFDSPCSKWSFSDQVAEK